MQSESVPEKTPFRSVGNCSPKPVETADLAMVVTLGPGKFYGKSLPRPRFYTDVKFNEERVDPPVPVLDPLMSWAEEAHWSMGGLNFQRHRLQGKIEGNIKKLRAEKEREEKKNSKKAYQSSDSTIRRFNYRSEINGRGSISSPVTPAAPIALKRRRRFVDELVDADDDDDEEASDIEGEEQRRKVKKTARKLGAEFDEVANDPAVKRTVAEVAVPAARTRSQKAAVEKEKAFEEETKAKSKGTRLVKRSSPRLSKNC